MVLLHTITGIRRVSCAFIEFLKRLSICVFNCLENQSQDFKKQTAYINRKISFLKNRLKVMVQYKTLPVIKRYL